MEQNVYNITVGRENASWSQCVTYDRMILSRLLMFMLKNIVHLKA